jgi:hypothetical protein
MKSLLCIPLFLALLATAAGAKTVAIAGENLSIDLPDAWTQSDKPDLLLFASDAGGASAIAIRKFPNETDESIGSGFIRDMKQGMVEQGRSIGTNVAIEAESPLTLGGAPAYLIQSRMIPPNSKSIAVRTYVVDANDSFYILSLQSTEPALDAQLQAMAQSFRFTVPPRLPTDGADALGYQVGRVIGVVLVLAVAWVLIKRVRARN